MSDVWLTVLQVWAKARESKGADLTAEEQWHVGTDLIAKSGDPVSAERVRAEPNNYYRLKRVLEIVLHSGRSLADYDTDRDSSPGFDFRSVCWLCTSWFAKCKCSPCIQRLKHLTCPHRVYWGMPD